MIMVHTVTVVYDDETRKAEVYRRRTTEMFPTDLDAGIEVAVGLDWLELTRTITSVGRGIARDHQEWQDIPFAVTRR